MRSSRQHELIAIPPLSRDSSIAKSRIHLQRSAAFALQRGPTKPGLPLTNRCS
jgi:hypothetical protein